jgi:SDR family mycofactocin-dependent oxidoreductase
MSGRVAIVTGAARGIGAATVARLARDGWTVLAVDRAQDDPRLPYALGTSDELLRVVETAGGPALAVHADASDEEAMGEVVAQADRDLGGLDALIAAAGVIAGGVPLWEMDRRELDAVLENNLGATIACARAALPALLRRPEPRTGRFVAVASTAATRGLPMLAAYCAAKAGVVGLVKALAIELRGTGVTANAVSPGSTQTAILEETARLYALDTSESFARQQTIERLIEPAEVAEMIAWVASAGSGAVTGADLAIDGGLSL